MIFLQNFTTSTFGLRKNEVKNIGRLFLPPPPRLDILGGIRRLRLGLKQPRPRCHPPPREVFQVKPEPDPADSIHSDDEEDYGGKAEEEEF